MVLYFGTLPPICPFFLIVENVGVITLLSGRLQTHNFWPLGELPLDWGC